MIHVFDDQQNRTIYIRQVPVQSLQTATVSLCAVGQSPWISLHTSWQAAGKLAGELIFTL